MSRCQVGPSHESVSRKREQVVLPGSIGVCLNVRGSRVYDSNSDTKTGYDHICLASIANPGDHLRTGALSSLPGLRIPPPQGLNVLMMASAKTHVDCGDVNQSSPLRVMRRDEQMYVLL
jgi:hypothetical protein